MYLFTRAPCFFKAMALCLLLLLGAKKEGYGQMKVLANQVTASSHVDNRGNAIVDDNSYAIVKSYGGIAVGLGSYAGELELKFNSFPTGQTKIPAYTTTYIQLGGGANDILNVLLGGNLGKALADILGTVLLGNHYFEIEVRDGTTTVALNNSISGFESNEFRLIYGADGNFYAAVTPTLPYDKIIIRDITSALLLGTNNSISVYKAFYFLGEQNTCSYAFGTSFEEIGLNLDLLNDLGGAGVTNPEYAIDRDTSTFSEISIGTLGLGAGVYQNIYFNTLSNPQDNFTIRLAIENAGVLTTDLLGSMQVIAYNGNTPVYTTTLQSGVINGLDLLTLLKSNRPITLSFNPTAAFDRISIGYNSLVSLSALSNSPIRLYEVTRTPPPPSIEGVDENQNLYVCEGDGPLVIKIENPNSGYEYHWYTDSELGTAIDTGNSHALPGPFAYGDTYTFYVSASKTGCSDESSRTMVIVNVLPQAGKPHLTITDIIN